MEFRLLMLSAMYENGGNTTHRLLDGHPQLFVYPFESQPGTKFVSDHLSGMYPFKYRWPVFPAGIEPNAAYKLIKDEEAKIRSRTPFVSKFRNADFDMSDDERCDIFCDHLKERETNTPNSVEAYFVATFKAWKNCKKTGKEEVYVGYSPVIAVDGEKIIKDMKGSGYVLHVVRNPFSAYADTKKRPVPLSLDHYVTAWNLCQQYAKVYESKYPDNFFIVRYEDVISDPEKILGEIMAKMSLKGSGTLRYPSWNGEKLTEVYPWGTIRIPTKEANLNTAGELEKNEINEIVLRAGKFIETFEYSEIYDHIK